MRKFILFIMLTLLCFYSHSYCNDKCIKYSNIITCDTTINIANLIDALIQVESNGNPYAISSDSTCVGVLQIKKIVVDDCNEYLLMKGKKNKFNYEDRFNKEKSIEMFLLIQERYCNFKPERSNTYIEHMIRLWNGGCGYKLISTQSYYEKVISIYNKKQIK